MILPFGTVVPDSTKGCDELIVRSLIEVTFWPPTVITLATTVSGTAVGWMVEVDGVVVVAVDAADFDVEVEGVVFELGGVLDGVDELGAAWTVMVPEPFMQLGEFGHVPW